MKKLYKLSLIIFVPFIAGLILSFVGGSVNENLAYAGRLIMSYGIPITMLIVFIIGMVLMITGRLGDNNKKSLVIEEHSEKEQEEEKIKDINSSYRYRSKLKQGEYMSDHISKIYKNSTTKEKVLGWLFFAFLMIDFVLIFVFTYMRMLVGIIVCFSIFCGTILIAAIVKIILEKVSKNISKRKIEDKDILHGVVENCFFSSSTSVGGAHSHSTTRLTKVTYRVVISFNGEKFNAYSEEFFNTGDRVKFVQKGKKLATIIEKEETLDI